MSKNRVNITISLRDNDQIVRRLREMGAQGDQTAQRLARAFERPNRPLATLNRGMAAGRRAIQGFSAAAIQAGGPVGRLAGTVGLLSGGIGRFGLAVGAATVTIGGIIAVLQRAVSVASDFDRTYRRIDGVLRATGNASGLTRQEIAEFADEMDRLTLTSRKAVLDASAALLTFRSVSGETFKETIRLAQDMSANGFGPLQQNVTRLGRVLEDPVRNMELLNRTGIYFTAAQQDLIKTLWEAGRAAEAQGVVLNELRLRVGGAGAAEAGGLAGSVDDLNRRFTILLENIGKMPQDGGPLGDFLRNISTTITDLNDTLFPTLERKIKELESSGFTERAFRFLERRGIAQGAAARFTGRREDRLAELTLESEYRAQAEANARATARHQAEAVARARADEAAAERRRRAEEEAAKRSGQAMVTARRQALSEIERLERDAERRAVDGVRRLEVERDQALAAFQDRLRRKIVSEEEFARARTAIEARFQAGVRVIREREEEQQRREAERTAKAMADAQRRAAEEAPRPWREAAEDIGFELTSALESVVDGADKGFERLTESIRRRFVRLAAELVQQELFRPLFRPLFAQMFGQAGGGFGIDPTASIAQAPNAVNAAGRALGFAGTSGGGIGAGLGGVPSIMQGGGLFGGLIGRQEAGTMDLGATSGPLFQMPTSGLLGVAGGGLGGAGFGFGAGSLLSGLFPRVFTPVGSQIGGSVGGMIGGVVGSMTPLGPIGGMIGGVLGSVIGGLFGNRTPSVGPNAGGQLVLNDGRVGLGAFNADNAGNVGAAQEFGQGVATAINRLASELGVSVRAIGGLAVRQFEGRFETGFGTGVMASGADAEAVVQGTLAALLRRGDIFEGFGEDVARAIARSTAADLEELLSDIEFARGFDDIARGLAAANSELAQVEQAARAAAREQADAIREFERRAMQLGFEDRTPASVAALIDQLLGFGDREEVTDTQRALAALAGQFAVLAEEAERLGITQARVEEAERRAREQLRDGFDEAIRLQLLGITDPLAAALEEFERTARRRLEDAERLGADLVAVERLNAAERVRVIEQASGASRQSLERFFEEITFGRLSGVSPAAGLEGTRALFEATAASAMAGDVTARARIEADARAFLEASRGFFASGSGFQDDLSRVQAIIGDLITANDSGTGPVVDAIREGAGENALLLTEMLRRFDTLIGEVADLKAENRRLAQQLRMYGVSA